MMRPPCSEQELRGLALSLLRDWRSPKKRTPELRRVAAAIKHGDDPLGTWFTELRSTAHRRADGATYTPALIVKAMTDWAAAQGDHPQRVVDPGSGSGRYLIASAHVFPKSELVAIEIDPLARLLLKANAVVLEFVDRLTINPTDYRQVTLPKIAGRTLFIGNPPYVRHHEIDDASKKWFRDGAAALGFEASTLAGLHIHFFLKTRLLAQPGDYGAFITAAEWIDVNYGSVLRDMLANGMGGVGLHLIDPKAEPFPNAMATGAITCFRVGARSEGFTMRAVASLEELGALTGGQRLDWERVVSTRRWSTLVRPVKERREGFIELGELFRVHRGTVTGSNSIWIAGPETKGLPPTLLFPTVTKAREIIVAGDVLESSKTLRRVVDIPADYSHFDRTARKAIESFLDWAREMGADESYTARYRSSWWTVGLRPAAPILSTYMGRRPPAFTINKAKARFLNIAHGLYPKESLSASTLAAYASYLRQSVSQDDGRTYSGGLTKFEPKELERVLIPTLDVIHEIAVPMDERTGRGGRSGGARSVQTTAS